MSSSTSSPSSNLIRLDAVGETRDWNYEKPTLVQDGRYTSKLPTKSETFRQKFYENYPALKDLKMDNIVFKGGSILDLLIGQQPRDLDLFLVGLDSEEKALARVKELLSNFLQIEKDRVERKRENERARCRKENRPEGRKFDEQIKAVRNGVVITLTQSSLPIPIQIILLRYDSVAHCLEDDDLGATAIAFDGQDVWLNERSKFAIENITIVVEPSRLTGPTPKRLEKYFYKGFDLVLPQLDMAKLPRHYQGLGSLCDAAQLPGLCFAYQRLEGNKIFVNHFVQLKEEKETEQLAQLHSRAYSHTSGDQSQAAILAQNIAKLCGENREGKEEGKEGQMGKEVEEDNFVLCAEGDFVLNVLRVWPGIQPRQINNFYRRWRSQLVDREEATFNYAIAQRHFGMYTVAEIAEKLFKAKDMDKALDLLTQEHINRAVKKLQQWLSKGRKDALVSVPKKADKDGCQIFPRTYKQDRDFYGDFYKADVLEL